MAEVDAVVFVVKMGFWVGVGRGEKGEWVEWVGMERRGCCERERDELGEGQFDGGRWQRERIDQMS